MIEVLQLPETTTNEFCQSLKERAIPHRVTRGIPQSISKGIVKPAEVKRALWWRIKNKQNPLVIGGSGNYHHLTYGLCANITEPFGYIHIDRHSDFGDKSSEYISMGGFVEHLLTYTKAQAGLLVGCDQRAETPTIHYTKLGELERRMQQELKGLPERVYVSVDLDVLAPSEFYSGYETGQMTVRKLFNALDTISDQKKIIGGDIFGYPGNDEPSLDTAIKCILKISEGVCR